MHRAIITLINQTSPQRACSAPETKLLMQAHRRRKHVAVDIAAGPQRAAHVFDDAGEHRLQVLLQHAVQLVRLARRQPQRAVAKLRARTLGQPCQA